MVRRRSFKVYLVIGLILATGAWIWSSRANVRYPDKVVFSSNKQYRDNFGAVIAVDESTVVVGAPGDRSTNTPGSAYVYDSSHSTWRLEATLRGKQFSRGIYDGFPGSIDIDENTITALGDISGLSNFHTFRRQGATWSEVTPVVLDPSNSLQNRQIVKSPFAKAIAIDANTLVVGAEGAAYVFTQTDPDTWSYEAQLTLPENQNIEAIDGSCYYAGSSVAISGDTIVVGGTTLFERYCVNVFVRHPQTRQWVHQALLLPNHCQRSKPCKDLEGFGYSVAIEDDTVVVGTATKLPGPFVYCNGSGGDAAYIFERNSATKSWQQTAVLRPRGVWANFYATRCGFGEAVAVAGDWVLGSGVNFTAAPHLFKRHPSTGQWQYEATLSVDRNKVNVFGRDDSAQGIGLSNRFAVVGDTRLSDNEQTSDRFGAFSVFDLQNAD